MPFYFAINLTFYVSESMRYKMYGDIINEAGNK
jgi:hypothetical protein